MTKKNLNDILDKFQRYLNNNEYNICIICLRYGKNTKMLDKSLKIDIMKVIWNVYMIKDQKPIFLHLKYKEEPISYITEQILQ